MVKGSPLESAADEVITESAVAEDWMVLTMDLDYPLQGTTKLPGYILLRLGEYVTREAILNAVGQFMEKEEFQQVEGRITVVTAGGIRWRSIENA